jgi:hypothetical protein
VLLRPNWARDLAQFETDCVALGNCLLHLDLARLLPLLLASGQTWIAEYCSLRNPAIVDYPMDQLQFLAIRASSGCLLDPRQAQSLFREAGVRTAALVTVVDQVEYQHQLEFWRQASNCEGGVIFKVTRGVVTALKVTSHEYARWREVKQQLLHGWPVGKVCQELRLSPGAEAEVRDFYHWCRDTYGRNFRSALTSWPLLRTAYQLTLLEV